MVNWEAAGAIGEIVGAVAVVATLVYLTVQLKQNTNSVQSSSYSLWSQSASQISISAITNERLSKILSDGWQKGEVSKDTWVDFVMWHQVYFYHVEMVWQMHKRGAIDQEILDLEMARSAQMLVGPVVKNWWEAGGRNQVSNSLATELENRVSDMSDFTWVNWSEERGFFAREDT